MLREIRCFTPTKFKIYTKKKSSRRGILLLIHCLRCGLRYRGRMLDRREMSFTEKYPVMRNTTCSRSPKETSTKVDWL